MTAMPIKVMLVDDHQSLLWGLSKLIEGAIPAFELVGCVSELDNVLEMARRTRPDIVLLDLDMNGRSSFSILPELLAQSGVKVLILSGHNDPELRRQALLQGASGFIGKDQHAQIILTAMDRVQAGEIWFDRVVVGQALNTLTRAESTPAPIAVDIEAGRIASLTGRERAIISKLVESEGKPNKVLAVQLEMAEHTLRNHLSSIYAKLGVRTRLALYMYALRYGLHKPD